MLLRIKKLDLWINPVVFYNCDAMYFTNRNQQKQIAF